MKFAGNYYNINTSLLDKLVDNQLPHSAGKRHVPNIGVLRSSIRRDLENLLNTRRNQLIWPKEWQELNCSLFAYGIPDITGKILDTPELQNQFCKSIRDAIESFETRLKNITISIIQSPITESSTLHLRIEGLMLVEPNPELVVFNSMFEQEIGVFSLVESSEEVSLV